MSAVLDAAAPDFAACRFNMVESQIRPNKVRSTRVLDAFGALPREMFVPPPLAGIAYIDEDLQIGANRYLLEPMVLARFIQEANIKPTDRVLDIAPATGYSTALLAALGREVVAVEREANFIQQAVANLTRLNIANVALQLGPLPDGWKASAPYDVIIVNGAADHLPDSLSSQLAEGGRLLIAMRQWGAGDAAHRTEARLFEKIHGNLSQRGLFEANVKLLPGFEMRRGFSF